MNNSLQELWKTAASAMNYDKICLECFENFTK